MSWHYSAALVAEFSVGNCLDGELCARLKKTRIARKRYLGGKRTGRLPPFRSGTTWKRLTVVHGVGRWISSLVDSRAKTFRLPAGAPGFMENDLGFGGKWQELSVRYDLDTHGWRTHRQLFSEVLPWSSVILPIWGMLQSGVLYRRKTLERPIKGIGFGYLPTSCATRYGENKGGGAGRVGKGRPSLDTRVQRGWPTTNVPGGGRSVKSATMVGGSFYKQGKKIQFGLEAAVRMWPTPGSSPSGPDYARINRPRSGGDDLVTAVARYSTPTVMDYNRGVESSEMKIVRGRFPGVTLNDDLMVRGGQLNPDWVEWLMGWPRWWTSMDAVSLDDFDGWCSGVVKGGWWSSEPDNVPRATNESRNRIDRLRALGNGQVPTSMVAAWNVLFMNDGSGGPFPPPGDRI